jgi:hypothetical protein
MAQYECTHHINVICELSPLILVDRMADIGV